MSKRIKILLIIMAALGLLGIIFAGYLYWNNQYLDKHVIQSGDQQLFKSDQFDLSKDFVVFESSNLGTLQYSAAARNFNLTVNASDSDKNYMAIQIAAEKYAMQKLNLTLEQYCALVIPVKSKSGLDVGSMLCTEDLE